MIFKRSAILFGINDYHANPLKNAANDASALAMKLKDLGFETKCFLNVDTETMDRELSIFKHDLEQSSVGLFFFAGHGIQCKGENYLASINTNFIDESSCKYSALPLNMVIDTFEESRVNTKIIILDACRNNPFVSWRSAAYEGLAPVFAPKGTIIAYSTSPGQKASDGSDNHGIYTNALLTHIGTKRLPIEDMFKRVRNSVSSHTNHQQITWEHTSLMGSFCFNTGNDQDSSKMIYSAYALADNDYEFEGDDDISEIVAALKTYTWPKQNPAIRRIERINFTKSENNDVFVLGRNIYQAACGSASNAYTWVENIETSLGSIPINKAVHLLNGVLYEIYFNCDGEIRTKLKSACYEKPVQVCLKDKYSECGKFIQNNLEQYPQRLFYLPGSSNYISIDIVVLSFEGERYINGVYVDGLSCMYDGDGKALYEYKENIYSCSEMSQKELEISIRAKVIVPKNRVKFTYNVSLQDTDMILIPADYQLLRYI